MTVNPNVLAVEADDIGRICLEQHISGESESRIARDLGIPTKLVRKPHQFSHLPTLDRDAARRALGLDLQRLDAIFGVSFGQAIARTRRAPRSA